ncbi:hypothetical protein H1R20_g2433, partial [Candolleomyces eurysporus]
MNFKLATSALVALTFAMLTQASPAAYPRSGTEPTTEYPPLPTPKYECYADAVSEY